MSSASCNDWQLVSLPPQAYSHTGAMDCRALCRVSSIRAMRRQKQWILKHKDGSAVPKKEGGRWPATLARHGKWLLRGSSSLIYSSAPGGRARSQNELLDEKPTGRAVLDGR